ncbi:MAG: bifunctional riboflavin kinase/FAD synthetase [Clostridiales bacterium]|nr:bifunctional riboflavin kinase/FAD synthetase [Clostridiales bacterium]
MIVEDEKSYTYEDSLCYIALGSFDGIHKGHLSLVHKVYQLAKKNKAISVVYTFSNHPRDIIKIGDKPKLLMDNKTKIEVLKKEGIDKVYFQKFSKEFMKYSPEEFIDFLSDIFNIKGFIVGFNYKFGYKNSGDTSLLQEICNKKNYELYILPPYMYKDKIVSSTRIREEILKGNIEEGNILLGRPYEISGKVIHGKQNGIKLGFPTANIEYDEKFIIPRNGVYYTNVLVNNKIYKGITNIGYNPTFNGNKITVETNILDFNDNIYGCEIKLYFVEFLRYEKKFDSLDKLKEQLKRDKKVAEEKTYLHL